LKIRDGKSQNLKEYDQLVICGVAANESFVAAFLSCKKVHDMTSLWRRIF
jgi:hypothetical protein